LAELSGLLLGGKIFGSRIFQDSLIHLLGLVEHAVEGELFEGLLAAGYSWSRRACKRQKSSSALQCFESRYLQL